MAHDEITVVVVEDDPATLYAYRRLLEVSGFRVFACDDPNDALNLIECGTPVDVLVTDIIIPAKLNGFALARMAALRRPSIKIVYVTGYIEDMPRAEIETSLGAIIAKPVAPDELIRAIRQSIAAETRGAVQRRAAARDGVPRLGA
jgi:CheY-like chemotaxis protein